ncbi:MAG TPA: PQQ-binding-like beta-propeller repeat protein [Caulifigura sp.]|nr:PQQ-binding-like beta-propeller repeat protein [Caulifigura sp.]
MSVVSSANETGIRQSATLLPAKIRWWAAFLITFSVLLVAPTRLVIVRMAHSAWEPRLAWLFVLALAGSIVLTWNLGASMSDPWRRRTRPVVFGLWAGLIVIGVYFQSGQPTHRLLIALLFAGGLLCVPWMAWLGFAGVPRFRRMAEALAVATGALLLVSAVTVEAMQGDNTIDFTWTWSPPRDMTTVYPEPPVPAVITTGFAPTPDDFPQFLGPQRTGVIESKPRPTDWNEHPPRELWRKPVGPGWSGFAVRGDYAFTQEQRAEDEAVTCYRVRDGELMWMTKSPGRFSSSMGGIGPRATPTIHADGRLYTVGATGTLQCLDACSGAVHWSKNILTENGGEDHNHGVCGSPLIVGDLVVVAPTGTASSSLVAYDRLTGERRWQAGQSMASYASPTLLRLAGRDQVLLHTQQVLESHDPETGKLLWEFSWSNANVNNCSEPIVIDADKGRLVVTTGYGVGAALIEVTPGEPTWNVATLWTSRDMKTKFTTAVRVGEYLYGLDDGILGCISLADGKRKWKTGRYNHGQILLVGSTLLVQAEMGDVALVDPRPQKFVELARIPMLKGKTWNNPTVAGKYVLVRNSEEAVCLEWPGEQGP